MARLPEELRVLSSRVKYRQKRELFLFGKILKLWARVHFAELGVIRVSKAIVWTGGWMHTQLHAYPCGWK